MNKISEEKKRVWFLFLLIVMGTIFTLVYLALNGNTDQVFIDIITEYTSVFQSNKSAECNLLFILIFGGMLIYTIYFFVSKHKRNDKQDLSIDIDAKNITKQKSKEFICALLAMSAMFMLIFSGYYHIIAASVLYAAILYLIDCELVCAGICTYYLGVYTFIGLFRMYVYRGGVNSVNSMMVAAFALIVSLMPLAFSDKKKAILRVAMVESIFVPCSLLVYLSNKYMSGEEIVTIDVPDAVKIVIFALIFIFIVEAIYLVIRKWRVVERIDEVITVGSCVTMMAFNRFDGTGAIMSTDMHHPFENIIGFSQIFELGQKPFESYIPVSGMYSIVQGAVFDWFGDGGTFANYFVTANLFFLFIIILIVILLKVQLDGSYVFLISMAFYVQSYNRVVFMLPIMLLLICPKLIEKKNAWIVTWFITSLFQGLYYPLYGAATCVAFFPLLIWQIVTFVKSGELKKAIKTVKFWIPWGICALLFIGCIGCLLGTLKHMLAMSGQSVLADGLSRFGQMVPSWFFAYLSDNHPDIRIGLYYVFTIMIPVAFVWIAFAIAMKVAKISFEGNKIHIGDIKMACIVSSVVIMPIICYTFTFIRLDMDSIYARSNGVLFTGMVLMLIFVWRYINREKLRLLLVFTMIAIPAVVNTEGIFAIDSNSKLASHYTVPDGYLYVENDTVKKIGTGFINQSVYESIQNENKRFTNSDRELSYMGAPSWFGYFYLLEIKGVGAMEIAPTVKSYSAAEEAIDFARANNSIIGPSFTPFYNYYLYHWLLSSGEYYWDVDTWTFIPNNGKYTTEEIKEQNKNNEIAWNGMDLGKTASSWGSSIDSLKKIFSIPEIEYNTTNEGNGLVVNFTTSFDGDAADFVYIEFNDMATNYEYTLYNFDGEFVQKDSWLGKYFMKKNYNPNMTVQIRWQDDNGDTHSMVCSMSKGKLLIPLGAGSKWLFNHHDNISIYVYQDGNEISVPSISQIQMLKLREAN